jgi:phenylalanyl-tRNA synthetase alpha subunit
MSATDNTIAPVIETPPKDQTLTETPVQSAPVNATTTAIATGVNATGPKVTPVQRLSSVYKKAKQTVTEAVTEAQKALHEKKSTQTNEATTEREAADVTTETAAEKKVASGPLKDLLDRVKVNNLSVQ